MRGILLVMLAAVLVVPSPVAAAETVELTGSTIVTAERSGQLRVTVPQDAVVNHFSFAKVTGEGRYFGFVLTRVGDDTAFKASHMTFPPDQDDFRHTSTSIRLDAEDADDPDTLNPLAVPRGRACSSDCRLPAGDYDLLIVADETPVQATITVEGLDGARTLDTADLDPLRTTQVVPEPETVDWGSQISGGAGFSALGVANGAGPALAFTQMTSEVDPNLAGTFELSFCVTADGTCANQTSRHTYAANAVQGRERLYSYGSQDLPAGDHGLKVDYTWDGIGGGSSSYRHATLFIHP